MFKRITARLQQQGLTTQELAVQLGMRYDTLQYKLEGTASSAMRCVHKFVKQHFIFV